MRSYYFGERLIPELLGKKDAPEGVVAETWEISDYRETTGKVTNGEYAGRTLHDLSSGTSSCGPWGRFMAGRN